jgi:RNA polymerase sigma factor (TIGR02999 family)
LPDASDSEIAILLKAWAAGDQGALDRLTALLYTELRRMAKNYMRRERAVTLQSTGLVHEAYLRLVDTGGANWQNRVHFFGAASQIMRRILVDRARARSSLKRGGAAVRVDPTSGFNLDGIPDATSVRAADLIALDDALQNLAAADPRKARVVELRFFGGLSVEETAEVLNISPQSVMRDWKLARAWLSRELEASGRG